MQGRNPDPRPGFLSGDVQRTRPGKPTHSLDVQSAAHRVHMVMSLIRLSMSLSLVMITMIGQAAETTESLSDMWVRPSGTTTAPLVWGRRDGIVFGLPSEGGMGGPRGLIRVGAIGNSGKPDLVNFIAIEPVAAGTAERFKRMAFSELEMSSLDAGRRGKRLWTENAAGTFTTQPVECLTVRIEVETFTTNRTRVWILASVCADRPEELKLVVNHYQDSAPIEELTLSATMGNKERLRYLWLRNRIIDSRSLYAGFQGNDFIEKEEYGFKNMLTWNGDAVALASTNEHDPASVQIPERPSWRYKSKKLTQYWRVPGSEVQKGLRVRVNGRRVYWQSTIAIPGGISFENFEVRQPYKPGQSFIFGMTPREPSEFRPAIADLPTTGSEITANDL
jgi:hypothetical protein